LVGAFAYSPLPRRRPSRNQRFAIGLQPVFFYAVKKFSSLPPPPPPSFSLPATSGPRKSRPPSYQKRLERRKASRVSKVEEAADASSPLPRRRPSRNQRLALALQPVIDDAVTKFSSLLPPPPPPPPRVVPPKFPTTIELGEESMACITGFINFRASQTGVRLTELAELIKTNTATPVTALQTIQSSQTQVLNQILHHVNPTVRKRDKILRDYYELINNAYDDISQQTIECCGTCLSVTCPSTISDEHCPADLCKLCSFHRERHVHGFCPVNRKICKGLNRVHPRHCSPLGACKIHFDKYGSRTHSCCQLTPAPPGGFQRNYPLSLPDEDTGFHTPPGTIRRALTPEERAEEVRASLARVRRRLLNKYAGLDLSAFFNANLQRALCDSAVILPYSAFEASVDDPTAPINDPHDVDATTETLGGINDDHIQQEQERDEPTAFEYACGN
jgi:hypothetical protein